MSDWPLYPGEFISPAVEALETLRDLPEEQQLKAIGWLVGALAEQTDISLLLRRIEQAREHALSGDVS